MLNKTDSRFLQRLQPLQNCPAVKLPAVPRTLSPLILRCTLHHASKSPARGCPRNGYMRVRFVTDKWRGLLLVTRICVLRLLALLLHPTAILTIRHCVHAAPFACFVCSLYRSGQTNLPAFCRCSTWSCRSVQTDLIAARTILCRNDQAHRCALLFGGNRNRHRVQAHLFAFWKCRCC